MKIQETTPLYSRYQKHRKRNSIRLRRNSMYAILFLMVLSFAGFSAVTFVRKEQHDITQESSTMGSSTNQAKKTITESVALSYRTFKEVDPSLASGETRIKVRGKNGVKNIVFEVTFEDGQEKNRTMLMEEVIEKPQDEILLVGNN